MMRLMMWIELLPDRLRAALWSLRVWAAAFIQPYEDYDAPLCNNVERWSRNRLLDTAWLYTNPRFVEALDHILHTTELEDENSAIAGAVIYAALRQGLVYGPDTEFDNEALLLKGKVYGSDYERVNEAGLLRLARGICGTEAEDKP